MPPSKAAPDVSAQPAESEPTSKRTGSRTGHELWIAIITAGATIAAAAIGTVVAVDVGTVEVRMVGDGLDSAELQATVDRLEAENAELRSAQEELPAQDAPGDSPSGAPEDAEAVRSTAEPISLGEAACLDLDSDAANWDVGERGDICVDYVSAFIGTDLTVLKDKPSLADCEAQTYLRDDVGPVSGIVGEYVCAWTDGGRLASIEIVDSEPSASTLLDITVWEPEP
jgi:hypothetical protein